MYFFFSTDATIEPINDHDILLFGRLINHGSKKELSSMVSVKAYNGLPELLIYATKDILPKEEVLYSYGVKNLPWVRFS